MTCFKDAFSITLQEIAVLEDATKQTIELTGAATAEDCMTIEDTVLRVAQSGPSRTDGLLDADDLAAGAMRRLADAQPSAPL